MTKRDDRMTAADYARLRGKPKVWVTRRIASGLPATRVGHVYRIDPAAAIEWELAQAAQARAGGSERDRLAKEQADKLALENARKRGELIYSHQVAEFLASLGVAVAQQLDALSGRTATRLAGMTDAGAIRKYLLDETNGVRNALAQAIEKIGGVMAGEAEA